MKAFLQPQREVHAFKRPTKSEWDPSAFGGRERERLHRGLYFHGDKFDTVCCHMPSFNEARPHLSMLSTCGTYVVTLLDL
jgi:hypothetical protein